MTDQTTKQYVLDELVWEPSVNAAHVGVTARDGVVTLTGHVGSYVEKWSAEQAAARVEGVRAIADEIEVRYANTDDQDDENVAKRAVQLLDWDVALPKGKIKVNVDKGWVTLTGTVDGYYQKSNAEADVRKLGGVLGVINSIVLKPSLQGADVQKKIKDALDRNTEIAADGIVVTTDGGKVTLKGKINTYYERGIAERTAWSAPGVTSVDDLLSVN